MTNPESGDFPALPNRRRSEWTGLARLSRWMLLGELWRLGFGTYLALLFLVGTQPWRDGLQWSLLFVAALAGLGIAAAVAGLKGVTSTFRWNDEGVQFGDIFGKEAFRWSEVTGAELEYRQWWPMPFTVVADDVRRLPQNVSRCALITARGRFPLRSTWAARKVGTGGPVAMTVLNVVGDH